MPSENANLVVWGSLAPPVRLGPAYPRTEELVGAATSYYQPLPARTRNHIVISMTRVSASLSRPARHLHNRTPWRPSAGRRIRPRRRYPSRSSDGRLHSGSRGLKRSAFVVIDGKDGYAHHVRLKNLDVRATQRSAPSWKRRACCQLITGERLSRVEQCRAAGRNIAKSDADADRGQYRRRDSPRLDD